MRALLPIGVNTIVDLHQAVEEVRERMSQWAYELMNLQTNSKGTSSLHVTVSDEQPSWVVIYTSSLKLGNQMEKKIKNHTPGSQEGECCWIIFFGGSRTFCLRKNRTLASIKTWSAP